jgi:hypothetical protein
MLNVLRPVSEVVKEGRILNKIRHLQIKNVSVFYFTPGLRQVLDKNGKFWPKKLYLPLQEHHLYFYVRGKKILFPVRILPVE